MGDTKQCWIGYLVSRATNKGVEIENEVVEGWPRLRRDFKKRVFDRELTHKEEFVGTQFGMLAEILATANIHHASLLASSRSCNLVASCG